MPLPAMPRAAPPWRALAGLALLVLLVHALVLRTHPVRLGQTPEPDTKRAPAFATRSIAPAPAPAPPPAEANAPPAQPAKKPVLKKKRPTAQLPPAQPAIDSIAEPVPEPPSPEAPSAAAGLDSASSPTLSTLSTVEPTESAATEAAATPATGAPPAPPQAPVAPAATVTLPASAQLDYKMTGSSKGLAYYAKGELAWQNTGASYFARMSVSALFIGSRTMSSTGQVSPEGLAPTRFSDKSRTEVAVHFEPDKGQISFSANTPAVAWTQGAQDRVSVFMQLGGLLAGNPAGFPVGATISMLTVGPRAADNWTFAVESEEPLSLPFGELATVKLSRQPRRDYDQKVEVWFAPSLGYLPVRNKITQANGDFVDQQLSALTRP